MTRERAKEWAQRQTAVGTLETLDFVQFQRKYCLQRNGDTWAARAGAGGCWGAQSLVCVSDQVAVCAGSPELPGHSHCEWGHQLMMSWPMSREIITLCCPSSSWNFNQMHFLHCLKLLCALTVNALVWLISCRQGTGIIFTEVPQVWRRISN